MPQAFQSFCIVADDLSGAADCAAAFARGAGPVPVYLGAVQEEAACLAIDTDSRAMELAAAVEATTGAFQQVARNGFTRRLVYKKIDSTLRGNVGAELAAALRAAPQFDGAVVAPAFPQQGRTLVGGKLRVQGRPADNLGHSGDLMSMLDAAGLRPVLLGQRPEDPIELARRIADALQGGARAIVVDAANQDDLSRLATALSSPGAPRLLVAGSAGLARALAQHVEPNSMDSRHEGTARSVAGPVMTVVGSFSKASAAQVEQVEASGDAQAIRLDAGQWLDEQHASLRQGTLERARDVLRSDRNLLFAIGGEVAQPFSRSLVRAMARLAAPLLEYAATCVLTGGDTARAMFNELGINRLDVCGEFEPGISIARAASHAAPEFILKAGGFGDPLALQRIIRHFCHSRRQPIERLVARS
jgi:uncharacterized protein YgbK (DUF1537 family)